VTNYSQSVKIPEEAVTLILKNEDVVLVGSVDSKGVPNIAPRFVLAVIEDEKLLFADAFKNKTFDNLKAWRKITVSIMDKETMGGFQLKGDAEEVTDLELVAQANGKLLEYGIAARPQRAWVLSANAAYSLKPESKSKAPINSAYE
jgi:predicted pyridoxine 5'-phosphate oxidase superfamily flavin-nucleotide-binding protein